MPKRLALDKNSIIDMYTRKNQTTVEIAKSFSVHPSTILKRLKENDIIVDNNKFSRISISKNILAEMYKEHTTVEIAKRYNISVPTVIKELKRHGIKIKGKKFNIKSTLLFTENQKDFLDGFVLSDGHINGNHYRGKNRSASLSAGLKYKEFTEYIVNFLNLDTNISICDGGYRFSCADSVFNKDRVRWYPEGTKVIPADFRFSPISMNIVYLSDGGTNNGAILLHLCDFNEDMLEIITTKLNEIGISSWIRKPKNDYLRVYISAKSSVDFLEFIGECPVACYKYKWENILRNKGLI